jgi:hypothetical protein
MQESGWTPPSEIHPSIQSSVSFNGGRLKKYKMKNATPRNTNIIKQKKTKNLEIRVFLNLLAKTEPFPNLSHIHMRQVKIYDLNCVCSNTFRCYCTCTPNFQKLCQSCRKINF